MTGREHVWNELNSGDMPIVYITKEDINNICFCLLNTSSAEYTTTPLDRIHGLIPVGAVIDELHRYPHLCDHIVKEAIKQGIKCMKKEQCIEVFLIIILGLLLPEWFAVRVTPKKRELCGDINAFAKWHYGDSAQINKFNSWFKKFQTDFPNNPVNNYIVEIIPLD